MTPHVRAWECAYTLANDYADRLTSVQLVAVHVAVMRGERAPLEMVALAAQVIGNRQ